MQEQSDGRIIKDTKVVIKSRENEKLAVTVPKQALLA